MGTRGLTGFTVEGRHFLSYHQFDMYPSGVGSEWFTWLQNNLVDRKGHKDIDPAIVALLAQVQVIDEYDQPTPAQIAQLKERAGIEAPQRVSTGADWYAWLRGGQEDFTLYLRAGFWPDSKDFGLDSLFCEWAYVVDTVARRFDVYKGFINKTDTPTEGIWAGVRNPEVETITRNDGSTYERENCQPVQRILSIPFDEVAEMTVEEFVEQADAAANRLPEGAES